MMHNHLINIICMLYVLTGFIFVMCGCGNESSDPNYILRERLSNAKIHFQNELYQFIVSADPNLKEVTSISRDLQIAYTQRSDMRYHYLCKNHPDRIHPKTHKDILNFEWTEDDEKILLSSSNEYANKIKKVNALKAKNQGHPDWPRAREVFKNKIENSNRYQQLMDELLKVMQEIDAEFKRRSNK
jgi:hypothetical protein